MQHEDEDAGGVLLYDIEMLRALWPHLDTDDKRALRLCCKIMRDAVDGQTGCLERPDIRCEPLLSPATCARLSGVHTLSLYTIACLRGMLAEPPEPGVVIPRLQSLRLIPLGGLTLKDAADYQAIASAAPWLTQLSMRPRASATALPEQMPALLSACSKLEELVLHAHDKTELVDITAMAAGTQLLRLEVMMCSALSDVAPLGALVKLQGLSLRHCNRVSDLAPLASMVKLHSLDISGCVRVSDLAPLGALVNLQMLDMWQCSGVSDLTPLAALVNLQTLNVFNCYAVSDLAPLGAMAKLQLLDISDCQMVSDLAPLAAMVNMEELTMTRCILLSDLTSLAAMVKLVNLDVEFSAVSDLTPLTAMVGMKCLQLHGCRAVSDLTVTPLAALVDCMVCR